MSARRPQPGPDEPVPDRSPNDLTAARFPREQPPRPARRVTRESSAAGWPTVVCDTAQTIIDGLENAPDALVAMLAGDTVGKTLVRI